MPGMYLCSRDAGTVPLLPVMPDRCYLTVMPGQMLPHSDAGTAPLLPVLPELYLCSLYCRDRCTLMMPGQVYPHDAGTAGCTPSMPVQQGTHLACRYSRKEEQSSPRGVTGAGWRSHRLVVSPTNRPGKRVSSPRFTLKTPSRRRRKEPFYP